MYVERTHWHLSDHHPVFGFWDDNNIIQASVLEFVVAHDIIAFPEWDTPR